MYSNTVRAGCFPTRIGLEFLESRTLLSATLPTASAVTQPFASAMQVQYQAPPQGMTSYSFGWVVGPSAVLTGTNSSTANGRSTGSVMVAPFVSGGASSTLGGPAGVVSLGLVTMSSSASDASPDRYNTPFTLTMKIKDSASGAWGTLTFTGTITGTLSWSHSSLSLTFHGSTQQLTLGSHVYSVTLPQGAIPLPIPGSAPIKLTASVAITATPAPTTKLANYSYGLSIGPSAVLTGTNSSTGNGRSTGSVMMAPYRSGSATATVGGVANSLPVAIVTSSSSASAASPDRFATPFTISLQIKDGASGAVGTLTFQGTITGTLGWDRSSLNLAFQGPLTRQLELGGHTYVVTLQTGSLLVPAPGMTPALIEASVQVR